jgi:O-succinylbenzoic acid--CoA ligase
MPVDNFAIVVALEAALDGGPAVLPLSATDPRAEELRAAMAPEEPTLPGTAVVVATSGSTGVPKGVELSAAALKASADADRVDIPAWMPEGEFFSYHCRAASPAR